jgi:hypothetical protein
MRKIEVCGKNTACNPSLNKKSGNPSPRKTYGNPSLRKNFEFDPAENNLNLIMRKKPFSFSVTLQRKETYADFGLLRT